MKDRLHPNKKYLALFYDRCETLISEFEDEEIGAIVKCAINYELYGEKPTLTDRTLSVMCRTLYTDIDIMTQKANERSETNRKSALGRWSKDKSEGMTEAEIDAEVDSMFPKHKGWK